MSRMQFRYYCYKCGTEIKGFSLGGLCATCFAAGIRKSVESVVLEEWEKVTMPVRAKFKVTKIERTMGSRRDGKDENGRDKWVPAELHTIVMNPVYANNDPEHENSKFWAASPTGEIRLGTVNADAVKQFELDKEYYIDFTPAE